MELLYIQVYSDDQRKLELNFLLFVIIRKD